MKVKMTVATGLGMTWVADGRLAGLFWWQYSLPGSWLSNLSNSIQTQNREFHLSQNKLMVIQNAKKFDLLPAITP